jgi:uncharacterized protein YecT (DUF1311 family)
MLKRAFTVIGIVIIILVVGIALLVHFNEDGVRGIAFGAGRIAGKIDRIVSPNRVDGVVVDEGTHAFKEGKDGIADTKPDAFPSTSQQPSTVPTQTAHEQTPPPPQASPLAAASTFPVSAAVGSFAPSFDCAKASTGSERLICSNQVLSALDVELIQAYKQLLNISNDKNSLTREQNEWRKTQRDTCPTADCMAKAYHSRLEDMESEIQYLNKPAQFR